MGCVCSRGFNDDEARCFSCCCCARKRHKKRRIRDPITICVIGLDGAGKTTIIKALRNESPEWVQRTHGFCREEVSLDRQKIVAYDLGGDQRIRGIWSTYYAECYAVIVVIDGADQARIAEANDELMRLKGRAELHRKPILVFLNKRDSDDCIGEVDLAQQINFQELSWDLGSVVRVESVSAISGYGKTIDPGIVAGLRFVLDFVDENYEDIDEGVRKATAILEERRREEKAERQMRLAEMEARESEVDETELGASRNGSISHAEESKANGSVRNNQVEPVDFNVQSPRQTNYEIFSVHVDVEAHQSPSDVPTDRPPSTTTNRTVSVKSVFSPQSLPEAVVSPTPKPESKPTSPEVFAGDREPKNDSNFQTNPQIAPIINEWPIAKRKHRRIAQILNSKTVSYRRDHPEVFQ